MHFHESAIFGNFTVCYHGNGCTFLKTKQSLLLKLMHLYLNITFLSKSLTMRGKNILVVTENCSLLIKYLSQYCHCGVGLTNCCVIKDDIIALNSACGLWHTIHAISKYFVLYSYLVTVSPCGMQCHSLL